VVGWLEGKRLWLGLKRCTRAGPPLSIVSPKDFGRRLAAALLVKEYICLACNHPVHKSFDEWKNLTTYWGLLPAIDGKV
jgi:hypothetical protein